MSTQISTQEIHCSKCNSVHGNNYFPLIVPDKSADIKAFKDFALSCDCLSCRNVMQTIKYCASTYKRYASSTDERKKIWMRWMRTDIKYFYELLRSYVLAHVVDGCNGVYKRPVSLDYKDADK